jgi:hypothetical protein
MERAPQPSSGLPPPKKGRSQVCNLCGRHINKTGPAGLHAHQTTQSCIAARPVEQASSSTEQAAESRVRHSSTPMRRSCALITGSQRSPPLFVQPIAIKQYDDEHKKVHTRPHVHTHHADAQAVADLPSRKHSSQNQKIDIGSETTVAKHGVSKTGVANIPITVCDTCFHCSP